uniref:Formylglycine-generating enzyme, required for sulfatase activity, contains SUMF1/FGE domain n=1 Tax=Candidatus Kentrum sp. FW TaxID=2126338 RepID=A0A450TUF1_9GAMM|nr:MAG: Formylglycine-generating enzyme, required for sulfatase activity, contains SUMF1/FGE domain [Candidatus Kentron sp. FW]
MYRLRIILTICLLILGAGTSHAESIENTEDTSRGAKLVPSGQKEKFYEDLYHKSYALVIGVSDYDNWDRLPGVKKDVEAVEKALYGSGFDEVTTVRDPYSDQMEDAFEDFISKHGRHPENRLLFYFAGHGHTVSKEGGREPMGYIVPKDAPRPEENEAEFERIALPMRRINEYSQKINAKHVLFLFDSCFSGSLLGKIRSGSISKKIHYKAEKPVRQFITAGEEGETVPDVSIFRDFFVEALDGAGDTDKDGFITGSELGEFLQKSVIEYPNSVQHPQYAKSSDIDLNKGDFIFKIGDDKKSRKFPSFRDYLGQTKFRGPKMIVLPNGEFKMGSLPDEAWHDRNEHPRHWVQISAFAISETEVTFDDYRRFVKDNPEHELPGDEGWGRKGRPVINVSWEDAKDYAKWLTEQTGKNYRLPSEAEWEYAARAGTDTPFSTGECIHTSRANYNAKFDYTGCKLRTKKVYKKTETVGSLPANLWGLREMHGNVWEWTADCWHGDYKGAPDDGSAWKVKGDNGDCSRHVIRGGSWYSEPWHLRSASRIGFFSHKGSSTIGFRLARDCDKPKCGPNRGEEVENGEE